MLWVCLDCGTRYAWDLQACPHCGSASRKDATEGSDDSSPGTSSEVSSKKTQTSSDTKRQHRLGRVRSTGSHSSQARTGNSSAPGATTPGPVTGASSEEVTDAV